MQEITKPERVIEILERIKPKVIRTKVIFRQWPSGEVIALFPELAADMVGNLCMSYQRVGQHGSALPFHVIKETEMVRMISGETKDLFDELVSLGYDLDVRYRVSWEMNEARMQDSKRFWSEG